MLPEISPATADALRTALDRAGYRTDGVRALLGREAHAALGRGEPEPAFRATADGGPLGVLVRMLLLGAVEPDAAVAAALAPLRPPTPPRPAAAPRRRRLGRRAGPAPARRGRRRRLVGALRSSTPAARSATTSPASAGRRLTLASATPRQARGHGARPRHRLRGPGAARLPARPRRDRHRRRAARAGHGPGDVRAQRPGRRAARRPVAGSGRRAPVRPDRLQPAVRPRPGPGRLRLPRLRAGRRRRARRAGPRAPAHLEPGGVAQLLGSWLHVRGEDWPDRVRAWLPRASTRGSCSARSTDPALHVGTVAARRGARPVLRRGPRAGRGVAGLAGRAEGRGGRVRVPDPAPSTRPGRRRSSSRTCPTTSPTRWAPRSRAGSTASTGCARTRRTTRCSTPGCGSPTAWCWSGTPRRATRGGRRRAPRSPGRRDRGGATRWTSRPPPCSRAAGARCRCASSWSCSRSPTTGRSTRWSPRPCRRCASWSGTGSLVRSE